MRTLSWYGEWRCITISSEVHEFGADSVVNTCQYWNTSGTNEWVTFRTWLHFEHYCYDMLLTYHVYTINIL